MPGDWPSQGIVLEIGIVVVVFSLIFAQIGPSGNTR